MVILVKLPDRVVGVIEMQLPDRVVEVIEVKLPGNFTAMTAGPD